MDCHPFTQDSTRRWNISHAGMLAGMIPVDSIKENIMKKLALAIAAILLVSLAGCAYLDPGMKGRAGAMPSQMSEGSWPTTGYIDFVTDD